ncbi:MAG: DUF927 domain-containing protein, partial [Phycisphaerae bacterium]
LAPDRLTFPLLASVYRSVIGPADFSLGLYGETGVFKSQLAALAQQHFGKGFDSLHLPGSWSSTANALEALAFHAKDSILVIDDFAPCGSQTDVARLHREADRILRGQGNRSGRARSRQDGGLRATKCPRGLILMTGEEIPRGQSLRARLFNIEIEKDDVSPERLTDAQDHAAGGVLASCMASYLRWLAPQRAAVADDLKNAVGDSRDKSKKFVHARTGDIIANLSHGLAVFLRFAVSTRAITIAESNALTERAAKALAEAADRQAEHIHAADPARRFVELIGSAIGSGQAHFADVNGDVPAGDPARWGWRSEQAGGYGKQEWRPHGVRIGWVVDGHVYLDPHAAFKVAMAMAGATDSLGVSERTLRKRLDQGGWLATTEKDRGKLTVRKNLQGERRLVLHLRTDAQGSHGSHGFNDSTTIYPIRSAQSAQQAQGPSARLGNSDNGPVTWAGYAGDDPLPAHAIGPNDPENAGDGPNGPVGPVTQTQDMPSVENHANLENCGADASPDGDPDGVMII